LKTSPIQTILVPTDGSEHSINAAKYILGIAQYCDAQLTLLHAIETPSRDYHGDLGDDLTVVRLVLDDETQIKAHASNAMMETKRVFDHARFPVAVKYYCCPDAASAIVEIAERDHFDLIAIGSRGLSGLQRLMLGSVAEQVCRTAPCPVLVIRE
jgi:nucleotide-binding universal stress UspA family protein